MAAALALAASAAGCGGATTTFAPAGPCVVDGRVPGSYPDLEARLPETLDHEAPDSVDSGRNCSDAALGSLISHDLDEIRFAGASWDLGGGLGVSSVLFASSAGALPAAWIAEFYEIGARTAKRTANIETSRPTFEGTGATWRLDTLNDLSFQTVVTWQEGDLVRAVLVGTPATPGASRQAHDELVAAAVLASARAPAGG
jgi:hypothetical protein